MPAITTPLDLMHLHASALNVHDARERMVCSNEWTKAAAPKFLLSRTVEGNLWRFRNDIADHVAERVEALCRDEPVVTDFTEPPRHRNEYLSTFGDKAEEGGGPVFAAMQPMTHSGDVVALNQENAELLRACLPEWLPDVPHRAPIMVSIEDGKAVSICASVRITVTAHAAGVDTHTNYRRQGHAAKVVSAWIYEVQQLGAIPLYSTSWDNVASQGVAARLELQCAGADFWVK